MADYMGIQGARKEMALAIHEIYGVRYRLARDIVNEMVTYIADRLADGEKVEIQGLGIFHPRPPISDKCQANVRQATKHLHKDRPAPEKIEFLPRVHFVASKALLIAGQ